MGSSALRVLYIGGTGTISSACVRASVARGHAVTVLNRGSNIVAGRELPPDVRRLQADVRDPDSMRAALDGREFDVVANFLDFTADQVAQDVELFAGRVGQFVFISSASAYQKPPSRLPVTESTPLRNPLSQYARNKIACEDLLVRTYRERAFPMTIVRPSHTYDHTAIPMDGGWTVMERMRQGRPVVVPGDGTSLWTLTHHTDFAEAFVGLLGLPAAIGEAVHITSDEALPWDAIYRTMAARIGVEPQLLHVASDAVATFDAGLGEAWLADKSHSMVFDNSKVKALVPGWRARIPFAKGAREIVDWYLADARRQQVDARLDGVFDAIVERYALPPR